MVYEFRAYFLNPGKMDALVKRFSDHTIGIFRRFGIEVINFWTDAKGEEALYYMLGFKDRETQEKTWAAFREDEEWIRVKKESEPDLPLVKEVVSYTMEEAAFFDRGLAE